ncbi:MAG: HAD family hydrolase [Bacillota bacterium]|nr:HAD family hydrolase [Bacillota bacterium]
MKLAIFDFDGTLFKEETIPFLMDKWEELGYSKYAKTAVKKKLLKKYFLNKIKLLSKESFRIQATLDFLKIFDGMNREEIETFFEKSCENIEDFYNKKVLDEIQKASSDGYNLVMVSGCFQIMLDIALRDLPFENIIGTKLPITDNGINFDQDIEIVSGMKKKDMIVKSFNKGLVEWKESKAYGDSLYDRYLMELTGSPTAVTPDDDLRSYAEKHNWNIID